MKKQAKKRIEAEELEEVVEAVKEADSLVDDAQSYEGANETDTEDMTVQTSDNEMDALCAEIEELKNELEAKKAECERVFAELREFALTFPKRTVASISDEVWESVRAGVPLAAAYALYEKKREASESYAKEINERNASRSTGAIANTPDGGYYSPSEVRSMTESEVRKNYKLIIESMKKWN